MSGTQGEKTDFKTLSVGVGRLPSHVEIEQEIVAWINDLRSDEISARVTMSMIKHKGVEFTRCLSDRFPRRTILTFRKGTATSRLPGTKGFSLGAAFLPPNIKRDDLFLSLIHI